MHKNRIIFLLQACIARKFLAQKIFLKNFKHPNYGTSLIYLLISVLSMIFHEIQNTVHYDCMHNVSNPLLTLCIRLPESEESTF